MHTSIDNFEDDCACVDREPTDAELKAIENETQRIYSCEEILQEIRKMGRKAAYRKGYL